MLILLEYLKLCFCFREEKPAKTKATELWSSLELFRKLPPELFDETEQSPESAKLGRFSKASPGSASVSDH